ncbi:MAG: hypothetical protein ABFR32_13005 [Bacteroidota bacterium]
MKKTFALIALLFIGFASIGQQKDYTNIKFKSKLRNYSKIIPNTKENGIDKELVSSIIDILTKDIFTEREKKELSNKIWLALSNPEKFDYVYKNYSLNTIKNWGVKIKFENPNFEPNPYLCEWTNKEDDFIYFQWVLTNILTHEGLLSYGDVTKKVYKSINNLVMIKNIRFPAPTYNEYPDSYLNRMNKALQKKGLIILMFENNFDFLVCKIEDKDQLTELLHNFHWSFAAP